MAIRRALYWVFLASIVVMPGWVMFGRTLFGAPLGSALLLFAILAPVFSLGIALVVGITALRRDVRAEKAVTWEDAGWVGSWLFLFVLYGFFVVVESGSGSASAFSAIAGEGVLSASSVLSTLTGLAVPVYGLVVLWKQIRAFARDTEKRLRNFAERAQEQAYGNPRPIQMDATFEPTDGPQSGQRIIIEGDEDPRSDR